MRLARSALSVFVGVALAMAPGAAVAERVTHRDALGDVQSSPVGSSSYAPAPARLTGDIAMTRVTHARRTVRIQVRLRDLAPAGNGNFHRIAIKSDRRFRSVAVDAFPGHWGGRAVTTNAAGRVVTCAVRHRIGYDRNRVTVTVPRRCLGRPAWVRVAVRSTVAGTTRVYADEGHSGGLPSTPAYGRRVRL